MLLILVLAACGIGQGPQAGGKTEQPNKIGAEITGGVTVVPPGPPEPPDETSVDQRPRDLLVEQISSSDFPTQGPESPWLAGPQGPVAFVAPSAADLSAAINEEVPDLGEGVYLAAYRGPSSAGYSISLDSARLNSVDLVMVQVTLEEPDPDAVYPAVMTYPYVVGVVRDLAPWGRDFSLADQNGQELRWPVLRVGGIGCRNGLMLCETDETSVGGGDVGAGPLPE